MPAITLEKKVQMLTRQMQDLRLVVTTFVSRQDPEGEYKPEFVARIKKLAQKKQKGVKFIDGADLLKRIG